MTFHIAPPLKFSGDWVMSCHISANFSFQVLRAFSKFWKGAVTYGLELMMALFQIVQGVISTIMKAAGFGTAQKTVLPQEIVTAVEDCGFFESIPLWAVTLISRRRYASRPRQRTARAGQALSPAMHRGCQRFGVCGFSARRQPRCGSGHDGMGLYRGTGF